MSGLLRLAGDGDRRRPLILALAVVLLALTTTLAIAALQLPGTGDVGLFLGWVNQVEAHGVVGGYAAFQYGPYPPLSAVLLAGVGALARTTGIAPHLALKLSLLAALLLSTAIVWAWTRDVAIATLFELSHLLCSVVFGYLDVYFMPTLLLALWALQRDRLGLAATLFTVSCLIKWQPAILAPILLIHVLGPSGSLMWRERAARAVPKVALAALAPVGVVLWVFGRPFLDNLLFTARHPFLSGNALNLPWIATHVIRWLGPGWVGGLDHGLCSLIRTTDPRLLLPPKLLALVVYSSVCIAQWRRPKSFANLLLFALLGYLAYGLFSSGVHENHLLVAGVLALLLHAFDRNHLGTMFIWILAANLNLLLFYSVRGAEVGRERVVGGLDVALIAAFVNVAAFVVLFARARRS